MVRTLVPLVLLSLFAGAAALGLYPQVAHELSELTGPRTASAQVPASSVEPDLNRPQGAPSAPVGAVRPSQWPNGTPPSEPVARTASLTPAAPPYPNAIRPGTGAPLTSPQSGAAAPPSASGPISEPAETANKPIAPNPILQPGYQFQGQEVLARIGAEIVLASDLLPGVNDILAQNADKIPPDQVDQMRLMLLRQRLTQSINTKLIVAAAKRDIPAERLPTIKEKVNEHFDKTQLKKLIESAGVSSRTELDTKLRTMGSSLEAQRAAFFERSLAQQWVQQQVKDDEEITHQEMLAYYRDNSVDFESEPKARWEHILVRIEKYPDKQTAYSTIAREGNRIMAGAPLAEVARAISGDITASDGGVHDWTTKGSLVSEVLDEAIFTLPVGKLSRILEDDKGFHIVRVVERNDGGKQPFQEAQATIKQKIADERKEAQTKAYLDGLRQKTPVWTAFDGLPDA